MKKYLNPILCAAVGALTFIMFLLPTASIMGFNANGYDTISFEVSGVVTVWSIAAIVLLIVAIALVVLGVLEILRRANVVKFDLRKVLKIVFYVAVAACALAFIMNIVYVAQNSISLGAAMIITTILYVAVLVVNLVVKDAE